MSDNTTKIPNTKQRKKSLSETLDTLESEVKSISDRKDELLKKISEKHEDFLNIVFGDEDKKKEDGELSILGDIENSQNKINSYYSKLFDDDDCIEKQIITLRDESKKIRDQLEGDIEKLKGTFEDFCKKIDNRESKIEEQDKKISKSQSDLNSLTSESQKLLQELTDKSLHNAFKLQAKEKKEAHRWYFGFSIASLLFGVTAISLMQIFRTKLGISGYEIWLTRLFVSIPTGLAFWICVSKSNITMNLAEEYQHKASISEALSGYRKLWDLEHDSPEYQDFFNPTLSHLIKNPSDKVKFNQDDLGKVSSVIPKVDKT